MPGNPPGKWYIYWATITLPLMYLRWKVHMQTHNLIILLKRNIILHEAFAQRKRDPTSPPKDCSLKKRIKKTEHHLQASTQWKEYYFVIPPPFHYLFSVCTILWNEFVFSQHSHLCSLHGYISTNNLLALSRRVHTAQPTKAATKSLNVSILDFTAF